MDVVEPSNAMDRLNAEWTYVQESPEAIEQVQRWSHRWLALSGCESPSDVMAACYFSDGLSDAALSTLLRIVNGRHEGDDLAAWLVLQSLLGPAVRHCQPRYSHGFDDPGDAAGVLIAALIEAIATYPLDRRVGVKDHLLDRAGTAFRRKARAYRRTNRKAHAEREWREVPYDPAVLGGAVADEVTTTDPLIDVAETLAAQIRREVVTVSRKGARRVTPAYAFAR